MTQRKLIPLLWTVIIVILVGAAIGAFILAHRADELTTTNDQLNGDVASLREQLRQAKASPSPSAAASATPSPTVSAAPSPSASPTPTPSPQR